MIRVLSFLAFAAFLAYGVTTSANNAADHIGARHAQITEALK